MLYFWWGCRGYLKLITLRSERWKKKQKQCPRFLMPRLRSVWNQAFWIIGLSSMPTINSNFAGTMPMSLTVINCNFPLQPYQKYNITQYEELGFSQLTRMKNDYTTNSHYLTYHRNKNKWTSNHRIDGRWWPVATANLKALSFISVPFHSPSAMLTVSGILKPCLAIFMAGLKSSFQGNLPYFFHATSIPRSSPGTATARPPAKRRKGAKDGRHHAATARIVMTI